MGSRPLHALQLVGVGLQVVEFYIHVAVLDVLVGLCCERLAAELTNETTLGCTTSPALALGFVFIFVFGFVFGLALALGFLALPWLLFSWGQLFQKNGRMPRRGRLFAAQQ